MVRWPGRAVAVVALLGALVVPLTPAAVASPSAGARTLVAAAADDQAAQSLAERYAPVLRVREQLEPCGDGEPYLPIDVDTLLPDTGVAFRGPWHPRDLVKIAPTGTDLGEGYLDYHLDFPGDALSPGCDFETWARQVTEGSRPTTYAHVTGEPTRPGKVALQYWFFYVFNDFNNKHEGDWEMIQLVFDAPDAAGALSTEPTSVGYTQHSSAERAEWGSDKLELVDGTHPVVYPAEGSHANFFSPALHLGNSSAAGVGCDDTTTPHEELRPDVAFMPTQSSEYLTTFPWLAFEGRWGEQQTAFFNGPTGPNMKERWTEPIQWTENSWRDNSIEVPLGSTVTPSATTFFCGVVEGGSALLLELVRNPLPVALALLLLVVLFFVVAARTEWRPADPLPVRRRRAWGQVLATSWQLYRRHPLQLLAVGAVYLPVMILASLLEWLLSRLPGISALTTEGGITPLATLLVFVIGSLVSLAGYFVVLAGTAAAVADLDRGEALSAAHAFRQVLVRWRALTSMSLLLVLVVGVLVLPIVTLPLAAYFAVRHAFAIHVVMTEGLGGRAALRRSRDLATGHFWRVALLAGLLVLVGAVLGPLTGVALLLASSASVWVVNLVSAVIYTVTIPFVSVGLTYLYADLLARAEPAEGPGEPVEPAPVRPAGVGG